MVRGHQDSNLKGQAEVAHTQFMMLADDGARSPVPSLNHHNCSPSVCPKVAVKSRATPLSHRTGWKIVRVRGRRHREKPGVKADGYVKLVRQAIADAEKEEQNVTGRTQLFCT